MISAAFHPSAPSLQSHARRAVPAVASALTNPESIPSRTLSQLLTMLPAIYPLSVIPFASQAFPLPPESLFRNHLEHLHGLTHAEVAFSRVDVWHQLAKENGYHPFLHGGVPVRVVDTTVEFFAGRF
ncbi:unnamed protein product [Tuber aestivum]|uniref:Uncharacterized protein n=1 Tax=Tuber aestivum TaxID=59557 RepID=A0A292Q5Q5_9PEZI|nr:unnamed protein product [Tuber aestivum]